MTPSEHKELEQLLEHLCSGTLTVEQEQQLNQKMLASASAREYYSDYLDVHLSLVEYAKQRGGVEIDGANEPLIGEMSAADEKLVGQVQHANSLGKDRSQRPSASQRKPFYLLLAGIAAGLLVLAGVSSLGYFSKSPATAQQLPSGPLEEEGQSSLYVAQVTKVTDEIVWDKISHQPEFLMRVQRGDRIDIDAGLIQLDFYGGASLILQGPCVFVPTGDNSGRLELGSITGNVSVGDFLLTTPTARVIDLGTEFGVSVDSKQTTSVCVFDGKVKVKSGIAEAANVSSILLNEGMSAQVDREGALRRTSQIGNDGMEKFVRQIPGQLLGNKDEVSLVDLFSAKSASQLRLAGVIAPDSGEPDRTPWLREDGPGYHTSSGYQKTAWHPFVDGVFIPSRAEKHTPLDAASHTFQFPENSGRTWGPVWSRRKFTTVETSIAYEDYWGTMTLGGIIEGLKRCETGMIGLHANVGVTFDLNELRNRSYWPKSFQTRVQNLDNSLTKSPEWAKDRRFDADFHVFVDGELRKNRLGFTRADGVAVIEVELSDQDRFLTLVSTDSGGESETSDGFRDGFDHVVLIDPILELESR